MMIFDGHADLLYDVTKWRQAGEDRVFERRHLPRLQAGQIGGLGLSIWTTVEQDSIWSAHPDWDGWRRTEEMMACAREELAECPWLALVRTAAEARKAQAEGKLFAFLSVEGMEPVGDRLERLEQLKNEQRTLIFYEAPHKLTDTLEAMLQVLGDRKISLARELTKIYEEVVRTTLSRALELYREKAPRGEFVLVVEGASQQQEQLSFDQALELVRALVDKGEPLSKAAKDVAHQTGFKKGELYSRFLGQ